MINPTQPFVAILLLAAAALLSACGPAKIDSEKANALYDELFMETLRESPEYMTYMGIRERYD